jgi:ribose 5-phosphate isomerase B
MRVAIGSDHGGFDLKEDLKAYLAELGCIFIDFGAYSTEAVDYPDFARKVAEAVAQGLFERGIVVDGAGIGSCMVANKVPGVRAAMCYDLSTASNAREHNNANVLTLGGGLIGKSLGRQIVKTFLQTEFGGGRHARRVEKIDALDAEYRGVAGR